MTLQKNNKNIDGCGDKKCKLIAAQKFFTFEKFISIAHCCVIAAQRMR